MTGVQTCALPILVSLFTHKKPHAFTENQAKRMKKTAAHGGCGEVRGGQLKGTTFNHSLYHVSVDLGSLYKSMA